MSPSKLTVGDTVGFWLKHRHHYGTITALRKNTATVQFGNGKRVIPISQLTKRSAK